MTDVHRSTQKSFVLGNPGTPYWSDLADPNDCTGQFTGLPEQTRLWAFAPQGATTTKDVWVMSPTHLLSQRVGGMVEISSPAMAHFSDIWGYESASTRVIFWLTINRTR